MAFMPETVRKERETSSVSVGERNTLRLGPLASSVSHN